MVLYTEKSCSTHVEYSLTDKGKALLPVFFELAKWGETYIDDSPEAS